MYLYRSHVALTFGQAGQEIEFYPPVDDWITNEGPPNAAATYAVYRGEQANDDTPVLTGTATLDASSSTDAAAGPSQARRNRVPLADTTGIDVGRFYCLKNLAASGGQMSVVVPRAIANADYIDCEDDLSYEFANGSNLVGLRHSFVVSTPFVTLASNINAFTIPSLSFHDRGSDAPSNAPPYRVKWTYTTSDSVPRQRWTTFDLCRAPLSHGVTVANIKAMFPDVVWNEWLQQRGQEFQPQIAEAFERLTFDIRMAGYDPNMVTDPQIVNRLVTLAAVARIMRALDRDTQGAYETDYRNAFEKAIGTGLRAWLQADTAGGITPGVARQLWLER